MTSSVFLRRSVPFFALSLASALACGGSTTGGREQPTHLPDGGDGGASAAGASNGRSGSGSGGASGSPGSAGAHAGGSGGGSAGGAGTGGARDAGSVEGGRPGDAGHCEDCLSRYVFHWGADGGLVAFTDTSQLGTCRVYTHTRAPNFTDPPTLTCSVQLPLCPDRTVSDIIQLMDSTEVQTALANHTVFGIDSRPVDGTVFRVGIGSGTGAEYFDVGSPCGGAAGCAAVPKAIQAFVDLLRAVDTAALAQEPCKSTFGP